MALTPPSGHSGSWRRVRRRALREVRALSYAWSSSRQPPSTEDGGPATPAPSGPTRGHGHGLSWPAFPPKDYLGQLSPGFQARLAAAWSEVDVEDCDFYHASELSDGTVVPGPWDLRGREHAYLGDVDVAGERVLELGPASGALTYFMEGEGADVVAFDVGFDVCGDILPMPGLDPLVQRDEYMRMVSRVQNSWWYLHRDRRSRSRIAYGNVYDLPGDLGVFDTAVFGAILLHLRDPFQALQEAARRTTRRIVVTDGQDPGLPEDENLLKFATANFQNLTIWWAMTPETVRHMLRHLGFTDIRTSYSDHTHHRAHDMDQPPTTMRMFTVVAERPD